MWRRDVEPQEYYAFGVERYLNESLDLIRINRNVAGKLIAEILPDQFDLTRFAIYARRGEYGKLEQEYGVKKGYVLHNYLRFLVESNTFGSSYRNRTARELAWGFYDQFLTKLVFYTHNNIVLERY